MIRLAEIQDVPAILAIFDQAREFMRTMGNPSQWPASYPNRQLVERDIQTGTCYVCEEAGQIVGTFALISVLTFACSRFPISASIRMRITILCRQPFAATVLASVVRFICQMAALGLPMIIINEKICSRADFFVRLKHTFQ